MLIRLLIFDNASIVVEYIVNSNYVSLNFDYCSVGNNGNIYLLYGLLIY